MFVSSKVARRGLFALVLGLMPLAGIAADTAPAPTPAPAPAPAPADDAIMVFKKDSTDGKSWASPVSDNNKLDVAETAGKDGGPALHFKGKGAGWFGAGWNWCGWWPADGGNDISAKNNLHFWVKGKVAGDDKGPALTISVKSSNPANADKPGSTGNVNVADYVAKWADGEWHEITIPVADLLKDVKPETKFDATHAWELDVSSWAEADHEIEAWISDVGFTGAKK